MDMNIESTTTTTTTTTTTKTTSKQCDYHQLSKLKSEIKFSHLDQNNLQQKQQQQQQQKSVFSDKHIEHLNNQFDQTVNQIDFCSSIKPPQPSSSSLSIQSSSLAGKNLSKKPVFCCHCPSSSSSTLTTTSSPSFIIVDNNKVNDVNINQNEKNCANNNNNINGCHHHHNVNNNYDDDDDHANRIVHDHQEQLQLQQQQQQKRSNIFIQNNDNNIFDHPILNIYDNNNDNSSDDDHDQRNSEKFITRTDNNNRKSDSIDHHHHHRDNIAQNDDFCNKNINNKQNKINFVESNPKYYDHHHSVGCCIYHHHQKQNQHHHQHQHHFHHKNQHSKSLNCVIHLDDDDSDGDDHHFNDHYCFIKKLVHKNTKQQQSTTVNNNNNNNNSTIINDNDFLDYFKHSDNQKNTTIINDESNKPYYSDDNNTKIVDNDLFLVNINDDDNLDDNHNQSLLTFLHNQKSSSSNLSSLSDFYHPNVVVDENEKSDSFIDQIKDKNKKRKTKEKFSILNTGSNDDLKHLTIKSNSIINDIEDNKRQSFRQQKNNNNNNKSESKQKSFKLENKKIETNLNKHLLSSSNQQIDNKFTSVLLRQNYRLANNNNNRKNTDDKNNFKYPLIIDLNVNDNCPATNDDKIILNKNSNVKLDDNFHKSNQAVKISDCDYKNNKKIPDRQIETNPPYHFNNNNNNHSGCCQWKRRPRQQQRRQYLVNCQHRYRNKRIQDRNLFLLQQSTTPLSSFSASCMLFNQKNNNNNNNCVEGGYHYMKSSDISKFQISSSSSSTSNLKFHSLKQQQQQRRRPQPKHHKQGTNNETNDCLIYEIDQNQQQQEQQQYRQFQEQNLLKIDQQQSSSSSLSKILKGNRKILDTTTFETGLNRIKDKNSNNDMYQKKGILIHSASKQSGINNRNDIDMNRNNIKKLIPKKRVAFVEFDPEIIGFRCPSDDEDDDQDLLDFVVQQNNHEKSLNGNIVKQNGDEIANDDDNDDGDSESDLDLKKITASNTLFNSNYGNFKSFSDGVLGRPKLSSTTDNDNGNNGPVKFKISDSYQKPLPETVIISKQTNSIRQMFEKNQKNTTKNDDLMTNVSKPPPSSNINLQNANNNNNDKENEKRLVVNFRDVSEQINHSNTGTTISNKNNNNNQNVTKIPKVKLQLSNNNNHQLSTIANGTLLEKKIKEIDIDRIRIPRASIQTTMINVKQRNNNNNDNDLDNLKSDIKCENYRHDNNDDDHHHHRDHKLEIDNKQHFPSNINCKENNGDNDSSLILVDNREGSILTLDSKNLSQIDHTTTTDSELFYLPTVSCASKKLNTKNKSSNDNHNLDTLSQSSSSSGCCSVSNSSSSSTSASSSSSSSHSTSPTNIETCSSSSSSPDSLESSPDSYDSSSTKLSSTISDNGNDEMLETVKEEDYNNNDEKTLQTSSSSSVHHDDSSSKQQQQAAQKVENQSITMTIITNNSSSSRPEIFDQFYNQFDDENDGPDENYVVFQPNPSSNKSIVNVETIQPKESESRHTSTIVINSNGSSEITTSILTNSSLKHSDSSSSEDKRSRMLAKMALDLQQHRNIQDHLDSSSTPTFNLSRSGSNQSSIVSSKTNESFRERLIREAYETNDDNNSVDNHRSEGVFGKFISSNNNKKGSISSDDDSSDDDCDANDDKDDKESVDFSDFSDISDRIDEDDNVCNFDNSNEKFSNPTAKKSISKLFKNVVTFNSNNQKKYKKIMQKNLRKTSKFITETTQQIRMDTSDMVRRLKTDKKSATYDKDARHGKWNLMGGSTLPSKSQNGFNGSSSNETLDEEPTLVKIKRLESTKYQKPPSLLHPKNVNDVPVLPPRSLKSKVNLSLKNINEEDGESSPCAPPPTSPNTTENDSEPPKPPIRRAKAIKRNAELSVEKALSSLEDKLNVINNDADNLDDLVSIIEDFRVSLRDCRFYRINLLPLNVEAHMLTSKTFWVTCYDKNFLQRYYGGHPCLLLQKKWTDFLTISAFCDRLNRSFANDNRQMLIDSIVLQSYCILARFETTRHDHQQSLSKNPSKDKNRLLTVGDINDALVGINVNDDKEIVDVLLLLPSKTIEVDNEETNPLELDSLSMTQAFCLQVFIMRLTRLISSNQSEENKKLYNQSSHYQNVSKRSHTFNTLHELKILSAIDIFHIVDYDQKDESLIHKQINSWFDDHSQSIELKRRYFPTNSDNSISILDYLELNFLANTSKQMASDLVYKDRSE
ncbi:uncharacterized protein LOC113792527 isoform X3 [Dermatophagoides pteronyssinus]|uniref:uncharacterized protein LOC113792527 isoform X3 n=1 Tax=Dermatophagoides pteronyssinus TaxID=6956 RepID=UPI003F677BC5